MMPCEHCLSLKDDKSIRVRNALRGQSLPIKQAIMTKIKACMGGKRRNHRLSPPIQAVRSNQDAVTGTQMH